MIVLDDPANPFSLIFSIRKIPNDLLDLERFNRPGESVPSRESRTSTLKGLFQLEGSAAAHSYCRLPLLADFVAKVFLGWRTKSLRAADASYARRREGPYRFIQNRSRTSVAAMRSKAEAEKSKDQPSRDF
jgi:hypothetical protein